MGRGRRVRARRLPPSPHPAPRRPEAVAAQLQCPPTRPTSRAVFTAPGEAPALASCPCLSREKTSGVGAPEAASSPPPPGCGGAFAGPPLMRGRARPLPPLQSAGRGGVIRPPQLPVAARRRRPRVSLPKLGESEASPQSPFGGGASLSTRNLTGDPHPRYPTPTPLLPAKPFREGCASIFPHSQARGQGRPRPCLGGRRVQGFGGPRARSWRGFGLGARGCSGPGSW